MSPLRCAFLGRVPYDDAARLQERLVALRRSGEIGDVLLLLSHPPVITLGRSASAEHVLISDEDRIAAGIELHDAGRGGDVTFHGPGQLVGYPIVALREGRRDAHRYLRELEDGLIATSAAYGIAASRVAGLTGVWVGDAKLAAIGVRIGTGWITSHGFALNVARDLSGFDAIVPCGIREKSVTSLAAILGRDLPLEEVAPTTADCVAAALGYEPVWGDGRLADVSAGGDIVADRPRRPTLTEARREPRPEWLRITLRTDERFRELRSMVSELRLNTVCEEARCPNIYECWNAGTATFMILGDTCTRYCGFCNVNSGRPAPGVDREEPAHVAEAVARLNLKHVVITSVDRDDLPDGGAQHFASVVGAIRGRAPACAVEVLTPDFKKKPGALDVVLDARPVVFAHNVETVPRLYKTARPGSSYEGSVGLLAAASARRDREGSALRVKTSIIVGLGEDDAEVVEVMRDLRRAGVDVVTLGQYLQPTLRHLAVARWVHPDTFASFRDQGLALGFAHVESGPLVRSSYHAERHRPDPPSVPNS